MSNHTHGGTDAPECTTCRPYVPIKNGVEAISYERKRQVDKGFTSEHDKQHAVFDLVGAAILLLNGEPAGTPAFSCEPVNPMSGEYQVHDLVRAGALIAAAIDRINSGPIRSEHKVEAIDAFLPGNAPTADLSEEELLVDNMGDVWARRDNGASITFMHWDAGRKRFVVRRHFNLAFDELDARHGPLRPATVEDEVRVGMEDD